MNLYGKIAFVTGGSRGIGNAIAIELARCGASVVINYIKDEFSASETVGFIQKEGGYAFAVKGDISIYEEAASMVNEVIRRFGKIDILVNNAGISKIGLFIDMNEHDWKQVIDVNLNGVFNMCHNAVKHMLKRKSGCIINISSIWGNSGAACEVAYSASKGGVNSFTKALAKELAPSNIRVNAIAPGVINTAMNNWLSEEDRISLINEIPMRNFGEPDDIGKLTTFLCSDEAKYITGQIITVDGGLL